MIMQKTETCKQFTGGCNLVAPDATLRIIPLPNGRVGYCPAECRSDIPCGFYPIWSREQFDRFFPGETFPIAEGKS